MAIFGAIPMPKSGMDVFSSGVDEMLKDMMQRQKMGQQQEQYNRTLEQQQLQHQDAMALQRAAAGRAAQAAADAHRKMDPMYEINQYKALENWVRSQQGGQPQQAQQPMPTQEMGEGMGMFSPENMQEAQQQPQQPMPSQGGLDMEMLKAHPILRGFAKKHLGFDPMGETPDMKRQADLQSQIELENIKSANKATQLQDKEKVEIEKDLPHLQKSLKGVDELLSIAKSNPDMFGHGFMPDRYAKTTKVKDFGKWQNLVSDVISELEQKLSAKGNIVALKMAAQLKPSHAEQQEVAIGKLESMKQQLEDLINNSNQMLGKQQPSNASMDLSQMSDEQLRQIISGGQ